MTVSPGGYGKLEGASTAEAMAYYEESFEELGSVTNLHAGRVIDLEDFRKSVNEQCSAIHNAMKYLAGKGSVAFSTTLSNQEERFVNIINQCGLEEANAPLMEAISNHFEITAPMLKAAYGLSEDFYFELYRGVLSGSENPIKETYNYWKPWRRNKSEFHRLLRGFSIALDFIPSNLASSALVATIATCMEPVMAMASDRRNIIPLVDAFSEKISIVAPLFEKFVQVQGAQSTSNPQNSFAKFDHDIAMPAEFLALLYAETQNESVKRMAQNMLGYPVGHLPYTFYETMGFDITREWHASELSKAKGNKLIKLIEHAIMVPGYDMPIVPASVGLLNKSEREALFGVLDYASRAGKENWSRVKEVLNIMRLEAVASGDLDEIESEIVRSGIPAEIFADNKSMLTERFGNDLGI